MYLQTIIFLVLVIFFEVGQSTKKAFLEDYESGLRAEKAKCVVKQIDVMIQVLEYAHISEKLVASNTFRNLPDDLEPKEEFIKKLEELCTENEPTIKIQEFLISRLEYYRSKVFNIQEISDEDGSDVSNFKKYEVDFSRKVKIGIHMYWTMGEYNCGIDERGLPASEWLLQYVRDYHFSLE